MVKWQIYWHRNHLSRVQVLTYLLNSLGDFEAPAQLHLYGKMLDSLVTRVLLFRDRLLIVSDPMPTPTSCPLAQSKEATSLPLSPSDVGRPLHLLPMLPGCISRPNDSTQTAHGVSSYSPLRTPDKTPFLRQDSPIPPT